MLLATALLSLSLVAGPERTCTAPAQTGIFRITAVTKDSSSAKIGMILIENVANCLEASLMLQDAGPTFINNARLSGETLTGDLTLLHGVGKVELKLSATEISGSISDGKKVWQITGRRTGGLAARVADGTVQK
jgi:hypothetical protein